MKAGTGAGDRLRRPLLAGLGVYLFIYVFSVPMLMFDLVPIWGRGMGAFLNILVGGMLGAWLWANAGWRGGFAAALIVVLAWSVEHVGVTTGVPFGRYTYSEGLGIKVGGAVPLPIPFAWLIVVPTAIGAASLLGARRWWVLLVAPLLVLAFDLLLEPFAAHVLEYWRWIDRGPYYAVPTVNFVAWWATGLALTSITLLLCGWRVTEPRVLPWLPGLLYSLHLVQFALVDLVYGYWLAALIGLAVLALLAWRAHPLSTARTLARSLTLLRGVGWNVERE